MSGDRLTERERRESDSLLSFFFFFTDCTACLLCAVFLAKVIGRGHMCRATFRRNKSTFTSYRLIGTGPGCSSGPCGNRVFVRFAILRVFFLCCSRSHRGRSVGLLFFRAIHAGDDTTRGRSRYYWYVPAQCNGTIQGTGTIGNRVTTESYCGGRDSAGMCQTNISALFTASSILGTGLLL